MGIVSANCHIGDMVYGVGPDRSAGAQPRQSSIGSRRLRRCWRWARRQDLGGRLCPTMAAWFGVFPNAASDTYGKLS